MKKCIILFVLCFTINSFAQNYKFGKVSKEELGEKMYPLDSTAEAAYLYDSRRTYFNYNKNEGFQIITEIHQRIKIYKKDGIDEGNITIPYYSPDSGEKETVIGIKGNTYNLEGGKIVKEKLSKKAIFKEQRSKYISLKKIAMPSINEGSVIEISYKRIYPYYGISELQFQYNIPVKKLEHRVEIPEYFVFNKRAKGYYFPLLKDKKVNGKISFGYGNDIDFITNISTYTGNNIPALKDDEIYVNNINNYRGGVKYELVATRFPNSNYKNFATNWDNVCKQIYKSPYFGGELKKVNYYKNDLETLLQGKTSDAEKIAAIYNFVKKKVKWNEYYGKYTDKGVRKAYKEGVGNSADINLMLTSMLRSAALNANPVLVSTKGNGIPFFPTLNGFNYVITMVELDSGYILLDATEPFAVPNILQLEAINWNGRKVEKDGSSSWVNLVPKRRSTENNLLTLTVSDEGTIEGAMRSTYTNYVALGYRKKATRLSLEELINQTEEKYSIETEEFKVDNKNNLGKPVVRSFKLYGEDFVEGIGGKLYVTPLMFLAERENPFKADERAFPVEFIVPWEDKHRVNITLPEGYSIESLPENLSMALPENLASYKFLIQQKGSSVTIMSVLKMNSAVVTPEYYLELKEFYNKLVKKQTEKIVLVKS